MSLKPIYHFYFLNTDISLDIDVTELKFAIQVKNIAIEGSVSQIFDEGLLFKKTGNFWLFFQT